MGTKKLREEHTALCLPECSMVSLGAILQERTELTPENQYNTETAFTSSHGMANSTCN